MGKHRTAILALTVPLLIAVPGWAQSGGSRGCATAVDQTVIVRAGAATPFRLTVANFERQTITFFEYPFDGTIVPAGADPLAFVFLPNTLNGGLSYATYRVNQPGPCAGTAPLGRITFVKEGPPASNVDVGGSIGVRPVLCGVDFVPIVLPVTAIACLTAKRARRRTA
jgi:hypothetical protein